MHCNSHFRPNILMHCVIATHTQTKISTDESFELKQWSDILKANAKSCHEFTETFESRQKTP